MCIKIVSFAQFSMESNVKKLRLTVPFGRISINFNPILMKQYCGLDVHKDSVFVCIINESGV